MTSATVTYAQMKTIRAAAIGQALVPVAVYEDTLDNDNGSSHFLMVLIATTLNIVFIYELYGDLGVSQKPATLAVDFPLSVQSVRVTP